MWVPSVVPSLKTQARKEEKPSSCRGRYWRGLPSRLLLDLGAGRSRTELCPPLWPEQRLLLRASLKTDRTCSQSASIGLVGNCRRRLRLIPGTLVELSATTTVAALFAISRFRRFETSAVPTSTAIEMWVNVWLSWS